MQTPLNDSGSSERAPDDADAVSYGSGNDGFPVSKRSQLANRLKPFAQWGVMFGLAVVAGGYVASGLGTPAMPYPDRSAEPESGVPLETQPVSVNQQTEGSIQATANAIDSEFQRHWAERDVQVAEPADWRTVCRRIALATVGAGLSIEELRALEGVPEEERVEVCLNRLLADERFEHYWGERLTRTFLGTAEGPLFVYRRQRFVSWVREQLHNNRRYDAVIRDMVTAGGIGNDQPQVNFLTVTMQEGEGGQPDPIALATRTTRAFLGMRIDCLQCHDDFLGTMEFGSSSDVRQGTQQDFHQLAAFYSPARFSGLQGIRDKTNPYEYQYLDSDEVEEVPPMVPYARDLVDENLPPRKRLAAWMTHPENRQTARCVVNRIWALMTGKPLVDPVDDIPLHGPFPPALESLADDFIANDWDLQRLIRVIVATRVFQLESRADFPVTERNEQAWALFPVTRLRPEQVAGCVIQASRVKTVDAEGSFIVELQKLLESNEFVKRYGDNGVDEFDLDAVTITQRLLMLNGKLVDEHVSENPILNACTQITMFATTDEKAVEAAYLASLNRLPSAAEKSLFVKRLEENPKRQAMEDMFWVLLNSSELGWNH